MRRQVGFPLLALGIALVAIGISSNRTFMYVGVAFIIVSLVPFLRGRR
jgi:hypothetical protein